MKCVMRKYASGGRIPEIMLISKARISIAASPNTLLINGMYTNRIGKTAITAIEIFRIGSDLIKTENGESADSRTTAKRAVQMQ